ncbi:GTP pyrophosphokinase family protein [Candidatus Saccharibacteria bacterium]|nr:GTP pyrophosphokinase family protein [Candidatus Saccharibacteria bacterium]
METFNLEQELEDIEILEEEFDEYSNECKSALRIIEARLANLQDTGIGTRRNPFDSIKGRIKSFASVSDKCARKGYPFTIEGIRENITDVAGVRITTLFRDEIYDIAKAINLLPGITVIEREDYVANPKVSGYASYHMVILVENLYKGQLKKTPVEVQIRDKAMDLWASLEHVIRYKKTSRDSGAKKAEEVFSRLKSIIDEFDAQAMELRDSEYQKLGAKKSPKK